MLSDTPSRSSFIPPTLRNLECVRRAADGGAGFVAAGMAAVTLSEAQLAELENDGFLHVPELLPAAAFSPLVQELAAAVDEGARGSSDEPRPAASACGHASADAAGYVSVWDGDRQRT